MNKINLFFQAIVAFLLLSSCEKAVNTDLPDASEKYVIEGVITNTGKCRVIISSTLHFDETQLPKGIDGAAVTISDNGGAPAALTAKGNGIYSTNLIKGASGHTYVLSVNIAGKIYTASSTMPKKVTLDAVSVSNTSVTGKKQYVANAKYNDPEEEGNNYSFVQYVNLRQKATVFTNNDELTNGRAVNFSLLSPSTLQIENGAGIKKGDTVSVEMQCIDPAVYKYWYSLNASAVGSDMMATPANPVTNISGGALGYFSAHTSQVKTVIVQ